jgi:transcriptional regulator with XRE-family HTH domain
VDVPRKISVNDYDNAIIGARIRELRISQGMTQEELARRVGVSTASISFWERGKRCSWPQLERVAIALKTNREELLASCGVVIPDTPTISEAIVRARAIVASALEIDLSRVTIRIE